MKILLEDSRSNRLQKKRESLYQLPSYEQRLLALPYQSRTATQKPTPIYAIKESVSISREMYLPNTR